MLEPYCCGQIVTGREVGEESVSLFVKRSQWVQIIWKCKYKDIKIHKIWIVYWNWNIYKFQYRNNCNSRQSQSCWYRRYWLSDCCSYEQMLLQADQFRARQILAEQHFKYQNAHGSLVQVQKWICPVQELSPQAILIRQTFCIRPML